MNITISNVANITENGINGDVPIGYKFGFNKDLDFDSVPEVGFNTGADDIKKTFDEINSSGYNLEILSMGMSNDYQLAINCGSNMIRVGSLIFGERN